VQGARQVGKTWLIKDFGKTEFKQTVYVNFEKETRLQNLFLQDLNPKFQISDWHGLWVTIHY
jgi:predicted AAA+ superfamily ATPase